MASGASRDGVNGLCDSYEGRQPEDGKPDPECAGCGYPYLSHPQPKAPADDSGWQTGMPESPDINPAMVVQPMIANRQQFTTPDGRIVVQYRLQFFNQDGQIVAEPCMVDGKIQPTPVELVFTVDTGRRTISRPHPLSPPPNGGIRR